MYGLGSVKKTSSRILGKRTIKLLYLRSGVRTIYTDYESMPKSCL